MNNFVEKLTALPDVEEPLVTQTFSVSSDDKRHLAAIAGDLDVSVSHLLRHIVKAWFEELEEARAPR